MANAQGISVAVERAVHDGIAEALRIIEAEHGIVVNAIAAEWIDVSTMEQPRFMLQSLRIDSTTMHAKMGVKQGT
jgi:hypothetical protein